MNRRFVIGVDGGGTGCRALVKNLSTGKSVMAEGGPANAATDLELAVKNVRQAIETAAKPHGEIRDVSVHIGLAGVYNDAIAGKIRAAFPYTLVRVSDDRAGAMEGALGSADGFLVSAGTGMIVGSAAGGVHRFVGGHGFQISDQGSGAWIGRRVLDLTLRCCDGLRRHSDLTREVLDSFQGDPFAIVAFSLANGAAEYAKLAPSVIAAGQSGDFHGVAVLEEGARHITEALRALGHQRGNRLCLAGGVGPHYAAYLAPALTDGLVMAEGSALDGALALASKL